MNATCGLDKKTWGKAPSTVSREVSSEDSKEGFSEVSGKGSSSPLSLPLSWGDYLY